MANVIGVRFKSGGKTYFFDPGELRPEPKDQVIVETARGVECGEVVFTSREAQPSEIIAPLKPVLRLATDEEIASLRKNAERRSEVFAVGEEKIAHHKLDMKLVDVEFTFDGKILFFFTSDGRVDFRELVRDLAAVFHTRIELRQIGVRDEAKMLGGLGPCGRGICCRTFLPNFQPVSIKMAKEQNLSLNPTKISGLCGRLMCCLKYEQDSYESFRKAAPKVNKEVNTPDGIGVVLEISALKETVRVRFVSPDSASVVREYPVSRVRAIIPNEPIPLIPPLDPAEISAAKEESSPSSEFERRRSARRGDTVVPSATMPEQRAVSQRPRKLPPDTPPRRNEADALPRPAIPLKKTVANHAGQATPPPAAPSGSHTEPSRANRFRGSGDSRSFMRDKPQASDAPQKERTGEITRQSPQSPRIDERRVQPAKKPRIANADKRVSPAVSVPIADPSSVLPPETYGARDPNAPLPRPHRRGGRHRHRGPRPENGTSPAEQTGPKPLQ